MEKERRDGVEGEEEEEQVRNRNGQENGKRKKEKGKKGCCCFIGDIQHAKTDLDVRYQVRLGTNDLVTYSETRDLENLQWTCPATCSIEFHTGPVYRIDSRSEMPCRVLTCQPTSPTSLPASYVLLPPSQPTPRRLSGITICPTHIQFLTRVIK